MLFRKRECHRHSQIYEHPQINPKNTGLRKKISEKVKSVSSVKSVFKFLSIAAGVWTLYYHRYNFFRVAVVSPAFGRDTNQKKKHG